MERKLELHHLISNLQEIPITKLRYAAKVNKIEVYEVIWYYNQSLILFSLIEQNRDSISHDNLLLSTLVSIAHILKFII